MMLIYNVNGTIFKDIKAFGKAWKVAVIMIKEEYTIIAKIINQQ